MCVQSESHARHANVSGHIAAAAAVAIIRFIHTAVVVVVVVVVGNDKLKAL